MKNLSHEFTNSAGVNHLQNPISSNFKMLVFYHKNKNADFNKVNVVEVEINPQNQLIAMSSVYDEGAVSVNTPLSMFQLNLMS